VSASPHLRERFAGALLRASGLPSLRPVVADPSTEARLSAAAKELLASSEPPADVALTTLLRWMAERHDVLFHGSGRGDLATLEPIRLSRDATPFGDQQAVFAASDPIWAIYFATLQRGRGFRSTRNGSIGLRDAVYPRWYFFSHNEGAATNGRFGDGWLYVLPREGFRPEPPRLGVLDSGQWASANAVTPLARVRVGAADFPFAHRVFPHRLDERIGTTILRAVRRRAAS
jgi:hypothetical protein